VQSLHRAVAHEGQARPPRGMDLIRDEQVRYGWRGGGRISGITCSDTACAPPGKYIATMCATPDGSDAGGDLCPASNKVLPSSKSASTCRSTTRARPSSMA